MHRLPVSTVNKIGKHFVDATDAPDIYEGTIAGICRDRKSKSICYRYYDPNVHASAPRNKNDYLYIVVKWALENAKFSKSGSAFQVIANSVNVDQQFLNHGPGSGNKRKHNRTKSHRKRATLEWYQLLINRSKIHATNSAVEQPFSYGSFSAVDLNSDGTILTFKSAMMGPDKEKWLLAHGEEIIKLIVDGRGRFIRRSAVPKGKQVTYYNPQVKI
jgi:hypothetical protein